MKRVLFVVISFLVLGSCLKEPDFHSYKVDLVVDFGDEFPQEQKAGAKVVLFNQAKAYKIEAVTDQNGKVHFSMVEPGFYTITVSHSYSSESKIFYYNGQKNIEVFGNITDSVKASGSSTGAFVIKEIYYSGSTTPAGKPYSGDQYLEIFNNTSEIQYADGISVLEHDSYATGENIWKSIADSIVVGLIWTVPGNGNEVPVLPGKSIILARDGINHRDDPNGNPQSPVNLGKADFEFFVFKEKIEDVDSPGVANLIEDFFSIRTNDIAFHTKGGSALAIAKLPVKTTEERKAYINKNLVSKATATGSNTNYYAKIANEHVIDAVEVTWDEAHAIYKRFPPQLDAGYTYVASGSGSGKCIRRKIKEITDGRVIYQDTNNSTEDFLKDVDPRPKIYE